MIQLDSDVLNQLQMHWRLRDISVRYLYDGSMVELQCNKTILAIQSKYFMSALVTFPSDDQHIDVIDLSQVPIDGHIIKVLLESFFSLQSDSDFAFWMKQGILGGILCAAKYFAFDTLYDALLDYISFRAFEELLELDNSLQIFENACINNLFYIVIDHGLEDSKSAKAIYTFLRANLTVKLREYINHIPVRILCTILKIGLEFTEERSAFMLYLECYKYLDQSDQDMLKPFILRYFDERLIHDVGKHILSLDANDYEIINSKIPAGRLGQSMIISEPLHYINNYLEKLELNFEYGGYRMVLVLDISRSDSKYLECYLYWDLFQMKDCLPEFEFKISNPNGDFICSGRVEKSLAFVEHTKERIQAQRPVAHCGWSKFIQRSQLEANADYIISLVIIRLASLD